MASDAPPDTQTLSESTEYALPQQVNDVITVLLRGSGRRISGAEGLAGVDEPSDYVDYGRCFARLGEPFTSIYAVVEHGLQYENRDSDDSDAEIGDSNSRRDAQLQGDWDLLRHIIPGFRDQIIAIAEQRKLRRGVCTQINNGVEHARGDDTGSIKAAILGYVHYDVNVPLNPLIHPNNASKGVRGWKHQSFAVLLTPIELAANEITSAEVISGRIKVTAHQLPRFLYPHGYEYSEDNLEYGLFQGHLMLRVAKHIFRGPKSVFAAPGYRRGGRRPVCEIINMHKMTARSLAYIAVQARFAISDVQEWRPIDRDFNYETFFWNLVDLLDSREGKEILAFYDKEVLGLPDDQPAAPANASHLPPTIERIKAQRAEKRARLNDAVQGAAVS